MHQPTPPTAQQDQELLAPPEKGFWERHSPHHEFPLSSVSAFALLGLSVGLLALMAFWQSLRMHDELRRPPQMDVVEIEGQSGGTDGFGTFNPLARAANRTEGVEAPTRTGKPVVNPWQAPETLKEEIKSDLLKVPPTSKPDDPPNPEDIFQKIADDAKKQAKDPPPGSETGPNTGTTKPQGGVKNPGTGGGQKGGTGPGVGKGVGPGMGFNKTGVVLSKQRKREMRWKIDFSGSAQVHFDKLKALEVLLAVPTRQPGTFLVWDLKLNNPTGKLDTLYRHKDKVQWRNVYPPSMQQLASVLHLPEPPPYAFIILPESVEDEMLRLEREFRNREESEIHLTEFEIQRRPDGNYGPVVVNQF